MAILKAARTWIIGFLALAGSPLAWADITIEQRISVDGFGPMKIGAMEGKNVTAISKDAARTEHQTQMKSKLMRALVKGSSSNSVQIIRLDEELIDEIDVANKQYTETSFQQMREQMATAVQRMSTPQGDKAQQAASGAPVDESQCEWSAARANIDQTGEHATIAGADAEHATVSVTTTCTDKSKGTSCDFVFLLDQWLATEAPGAAETSEFYRNYAKKLNLQGELAADMQSNARAVFNRYQNAWGEAMKAASRLQGYPAKTVFSMQVGGPQCNSNANGSGTTADVSPPPPTSSGDVVSNLAMGLFGKMHKSDDAKNPPDPAPPPGMTQIFRMSTETVAVRSDTIPSSMFEVPAGYRKIAAAGAQ